MKKTTFLILATCLLIDIYCQPTKSSNTVQPDSLQLAKISKFANDFFFDLKLKGYYVFMGEVTNDLMLELSVSKQKAFYKSIRERYGEYRQMNYSVYFESNNNEKQYIFVFAAYFEDSDKPIELKITVNSKNKISGIWVNSQSK